MGERKMRFAILNNQRIEAYPKGKGICPLCNEELIAKCGNIKVWHWSHKLNTDCDSWAEPESEWHLNWKNEFSKECQEVIIGKHRADIKTNKGVIIELQNSHLSSEKIKEREDFYGNMIWVLNGETIGKNICNIKEKKGYVGFKWKWFPSSWQDSKKLIYIDMGNQLLKIGKLYDNEKKIWNYEDYWQDEYGIIHYPKPRIKKYPKSGYGYLLKKEDFLNGFKQD